MSLKDLEDVNQMQSTNISDIFIPNGSHLCSFQLIQESPLLNFEKSSESEIFWWHVTTNILPLHVYFLQRTRRDMNGYGS